MIKEGREGKKKDGEGRRGREVTDVAPSSLIRQ